MFEKAKKPEGLFGKMNKIAEGTQLQGDIVSDSDIRIDGKLTGTISIKGKLVIGQTGNVEGTISCANIDIEGVFSGKLEAKELLNIKATAVINGEVTIGKLGVEPGATFNATCIMKNRTKNENHVSSAEKVV